MGETKSTTESKYEGLVYDEKEGLIFFPTKSLSKGDKLNIIFYGPPGTGKTYETASEAMALLTGRKIVDTKNAWKELQKELEKEDENRRVEFITFHQSYSYEEFVEGLRPKTPESKSNNAVNHEAVNNVSQDNKKDLFEYEIRPGTLKMIATRAKKAWEETGKPSEGTRADVYVLIIDEINRGDISRIFGELITIIEEDKRLGKDCGITVTLPYSKEQFGLPPNLYIIGTMNTADRSIALMDIALRRRFFFVEFMPEHTLLSVKLDDCNVNLSKMLEVMNNRIEYLYDRDHTLGHAYFLGVKNLEELMKVFRNKIIPLLKEYFFDDWRKIDMVLGCQGRSELNKKIIEKKLKTNIFNGIDPNEIDEEKELYQINLDEKAIANLSEDRHAWIKAFEYIYRED